VEAGAECEGKGCSDEQAVEASDECGVDEGLGVAVEEKPEAKAERDEGDGEGKDEEAFWDADEEDAEGP
jgi:hypothetical protein